LLVFPLTRIRAAQHGPFTARAVRSGDTFSSRQYYRLRRQRQPVTLRRGRTRGVGYGKRPPTDLPGRPAADYSRKG